MTWRSEPNVTREAFAERIKVGELLELGDGSVGVIREVDVDARRYRVDWITDDPAHLDTPSVEDAS